MIKMQELMNMTPITFGTFNLKEAEDSTESDKNEFLSVINSLPNNIFNMFCYIILSRTNSY